MKPTLVILAAGMASRYGSMKQTEAFGPSGETIMDYSIYDAIKAGFGKVVFIIREDFAENFKAVFEPKLKGKIETAYVFQKLDSFVDGGAPAGRTKPWGTGHALLCAKDAVKEPFAVINADDFYSLDAYRVSADFLVNKCDPKTWALLGYELPKTLSSFGTVSRGVCKADENGNLVSINEMTKLSRKEGKITNEEEGNAGIVGEDAKASMNFWAFHPDIFPLTETLFKEFIEKQKEDPKSEFFIPIIANKFIKDGGVIKVIPTTADWFGVTYKEDAPSVKEKIDALVSSNEYPDNLWSV